jgi:alpha-L-fucosidase 2
VAAETRLWYGRPAAAWLEALPVGNGRLGAMVFGGLGQERLALNEDTFWSGGAPTEPEAEAHLFGRPKRMQAFLPLGDLLLEHPGGAEPGDVSGYVRDLDCDGGLASVSYVAAGVPHRREVFASHPDQVLVLRWTAGAPFDLDVRLRSPFPASPAFPGPATLALAGRWAAPPPAPRSLRGDYAGEGLRFEVRAAVRAEGGTVAPLPGGDGLALRGASAVTVLLAAATSFGGREPARACAEALAAAPAAYGELRARALEDHSALFRRVALSLGPAAGDARPTDERLAAVRAGAPDPGLEALFFHYGRHLLISSSRPGTQPATLQGIWNEDPEPPWGSKWTTNINVEMNYWPAEVAALPECHEPLFDLLERIRPSGRRTAAVHYGCRGFVLHHNTDIWGSTTPVDGAGSGIWPTGAAWLCRHLWERWLFSGDRAFLARAYPVMREAAEFLLDFLIPDAGGYLVTSPSISPENRFLGPDGARASVCAGPTMDMQLCRELFASCAGAAAVLGVDPDLAARLRAAAARLVPPRIGRHGQLQEWAEDFEEPDPGHRHLSHLYGVFPGWEITPAGSPELAAAARRSLERRLAAGGGHTGWSRAWVVALWARLGEGDLAHEHYATLLGQQTAPNLMDLHPPRIFQIDGNLGAVAGVAEMLLQSHPGCVEPGTPDAELRLLPALPAAWAEGRAEGLRARGGLTVAMAWEGGRLREARVRAERPATVALAWPPHSTPREAAGGSWAPLGPGRGRLGLGAGEAWDARFA